MFALLLVAQIIAEAPKSPAADPRVALMLKLEAQPEDATKGADQEKVGAAFQSRETLWAFITAPGTAFADRIAAARRAYPPDHIQTWSRISGAISISGLDADDLSRGVPRFFLPMSYLPRLVAAERELQREQILHHWGLQLPPHHPYQAGMYAPQPQPFSGQRRRTILGHPWTVPDTPAEYPLTVEEKGRAPWPWQVAAALGELKNGFFYYPPRPTEFYPTVLTLPCRTADDAHDVIQLSINFGFGARKVTPEIVGAWRNIALNPAMERSRGELDYVLDVIGLAVAPDAFWLGETLMVDMAASAKDNQLVGLVFQLSELLEGRLAYDKKVVRPSAPHSAIDMLAKRIDAMDSRVHWTARGYAAFYFLNALRLENVKLPQSINDDSSEYEAMFARFRTWYAAHRDELAEAAAKHAPLLEPYRRLMSKTIACRP